MLLRRWILSSTVLLLLVLQGNLLAASRIKDVAAFEGVRDNQLFGYGLVVGLNGTGDRNQTYFSTQSLANMLERSGITVDADRMRVKNIAAVMVTATLPPFARQGSSIDVTVSSLGDAQSLQGGVLIMTPLQAADSQIYATAQGAIVLGGYSAGGSNSRSQTNHPTVGRIANGGLVEREVAVSLAGRKQLNLVLNRNDFTSASRAVKAINDVWGSEIAEAVDGRTISVAIPLGYMNRPVEFMSMIENAQIDIDVTAKVVMNERTGTVIMGKDVRISEVSIIHGGLSLQVGTIFNVSQPNPMAMGSTEIIADESVSVVEEKGKTATIREGASVEEVVRALNDIGAGPRDVIAILEAIKAQGALQAELEII